MPSPYRRLHLRQLRPDPRHRDRVGAAGVLAHETAHVTQHHIARAIRAEPHVADHRGRHARGDPARRARRRRPGDGGRRSWRPGHRRAAEINFTRDKEAEADRVGIGFLAGAGFDPNGMARFFETMARHEGLAATYIPAMLHRSPGRPAIASPRRARRAAQFPPRTRPRIAELCADPRARARADRAARHRHGAATTPEDRATARDDDAATATARRWPLMSGNRAGRRRSRSCASCVQQHEGTDAAVLRPRPGAAKAGHTNAALATFEHAVALFPRNVPVTVRYAETLMQRAAQARPTPCCSTCSTTCRRPPTRSA